MDIRRISGSHHGHSRGETPHHAPELLFADHYSPVFCLHPDGTLALDSLSEENSKTESQ